MRSAGPWLDYAQNYAHPVHRRAVTHVDSGISNLGEVLGAEQRIEIRLTAYAHS